MKANMEGFNLVPHTSGQVFFAWSPFIILSVMVTIWTTKWFKAFFDKGQILQIQSSNSNSLQFII